MPAIGFDNQKYLTTQSEQIKKRIAQFGGKLYLEFGGKLFDDYHASRVLPGFEPDSKIRMLKELRDSVEVVIAICAIVGLCNGLVVSYLKVQPFIATLGMQQVVYGICLVYTGGTPIGSLNKNFTSLASNTIIGIPVLIWIALVVAACFWFLYNKTRHGKYMYAIGGNEAAAEVAGVNVNATKIRIYILASCMFGLAGCLLAAKSGGASVNTAQGYELDAIAACTIGGVSTTGGVGTVPGVLVGVLVFELMKVALQFMNVNSSYTYIVQGLVIIVAVAIDIRKYLAKK